MKIEDGKGKNGDMSVSTTQRGNVSAKTAPRIMYAARDDGFSYAAVYEGITAAAGEYVAYLKNTSSTKNLFVSDMAASGVEAIKWKLWFVTGTAASGETVTPTPFNKSKSIPAEATAMAGNTAITGLTTDGQIGFARSGALSGVEVAYHNALILGPGDALAVEYDTGTSGICEVSIHFHFEDLGAS